MGKLTPILQKMYDILSDGEPHGLDELHKCCGPSSRANVHNHVCRLRKVIAAEGKDVICINGGKSKSARYRMVRTLNSPNSGKN